MLPLDVVDHTVLALVGGKAANLGELAHAGLPVPDGRCLTTAAYARVSRAAGLDGALADLAAVPAEDLPSTSFAGQQDTCLGVVGIDALLDAVRRCWASLWTDRAVAYRARNGIDHRAVRLAVVVQRMIESEVAGVLFTADPVTGRRRHAVVDAAPGLGEATVSGAVDPDHFIVDTATSKIVERRLGGKRLTVRAVPGGGTREVELPDRGDTACLTDEQLSL